VHWHAEEFQAAVEAWNNGAVDGFNTFGDGAWTYSVARTCGQPLSSQRLLVSSFNENLGHEAGETETFAAYTKHVLADTEPPTSDQGGSNFGGCQLSVTFSANTVPVCPFAFASERVCFCSKAAQS
jgi:hypothetical protein